MEEKRLEDKRRKVTRRDVNGREEVQACEQPGEDVESLLNGMELPKLDLSAVI